MPVSKNNRKNGKPAEQKVPYKPSKRETFIQEAKQIKVACLGLIQNSAQVGQIIVAAKQSADIEFDEIRVGKLAETLAGDLKTLTAELHALDAKSDSALGVITQKTDDIEVMHITVEVGNSYQNWQDRFLQITGPVMEEITELCTGDK